MRVVMLVNPVSGRGRADLAAGSARVALESAGIDVDVVATTARGADAALDGRLAGAAAIVAAGGDGTMRTAAVAAIAHGTPLWHLPCGTANLFARAMGTTGDPAQLLAALEAARIGHLDAGEANGEPFVLMASIGYDAEIVHELTRRRGPAISGRSYVGPMLRQLCGWAAPELAVTAGGTPVAEGRGTVVIAGAPQYMWGLNPARDAVMDDGLLDAVFLPVRSRLELLRWVARCARGTQLRHADARFARAAGFEVGCAAPQRFQLDGDPPGDPAPVTRLEVRVRSGVLPVLRPPETE